jgi:hypothetical protein
MPIPTYFSHSYRVEDQALNQAVWQLFASDFSFFVDPPSESTIHTHLERMMRRCSAFVAVVNRRRGAGQFFCSPFVLYEYGLSIQARRPRLLLIDDRVGDGPFRRLPDSEKHFFSTARPDLADDALRNKINRLREIAEHHPNRLGRPRGPIGLVVPVERSRCHYGDDRVVESLTAVARLRGFALRTLEVPHEHNALFALDLDQYEALIMDVRGEDVPQWVFAYTYGRLIPTIKLARMAPDEAPATVPLPPLVAGLRMDPEEPGVESVTYWRDTQDLVYQVDRALKKLDEDQTVFHDGDRGTVYFESIGRRPARLFISNAGQSNSLAGLLTQELRLRSIELFHYKEPDAIKPGADWRARIRQELETCDLFVALIGPGYRESDWCREEFAAARNRVGLELLLYAVEPTDVGFADQLHVADLPIDPEAANARLLRDIRDRLIRDPRNRAQRRPILLGASREVIVDSIRHLSTANWRRYLKDLAALSVTPPQDAAGSPVRSRDAADRLLGSVLRADADAIGPNVLVDAIRALATVARATVASPGEHRQPPTQDRR